MRKKQEFIEKYYPLARQAEEVFRLNPVVTLAQAALESGWGTSSYATRYHNFFGITGYGMNNPYWDGSATEANGYGLKFRIYLTPQDSFLDFARLITSAYKAAAEMSYHPEAYANAIAYSPYINPKNGDNRELYRKNLASIARDIVKLLPVSTNSLYF